jgi:hypothetical protein
VEKSNSIKNKYWRNPFMMTRKTVAVFSIGLILLAACGREYQKPMSEQEALDTLTSVTELNSYAAAKKKPKPAKPAAPQVSVADLQKLLIQLVQEGKIQAPSSPVKKASSQDIVNAINAINAIFAAIPQTNGSLSTFTLALSLMAVFAGNLQQGTLDLNTVLSLLQQSLPYVAVMAPQFVPVIQALIIIIPIVVTFMNTMNPPTAMLPSMNFSRA